MTAERFDEPTMSLENAKRYVRQESSMRRRMIYALLMLFNAGMVVLITALWTTEAGLPLRTHVGFAAMLAIGLAWLVFFGWVLARRRPLFALDSVIAGRLALAATTLFLAGGVAIAAQRGNSVALLTVILVGGVFVAVAATILVRASRTRQWLLRRREELAALV